MLRGALASISRRLDSLDRRSRRHMRKMMMKKKKKKKKERSMQSGGEEGAACSPGEFCLLRPSKLWCPW